MGTSPPPPPTKQSFPSKGIKPKLKILISRGDAAFAAPWEPCGEDPWQFCGVFYSESFLMGDLGELLGIFSLCGSGGTVGAASGAWRVSSYLAVKPGSRKPHVALLKVLITYRFVMRLS